MPIFKATYDGEVFRPDEPVDLEPGTRVRVTVEEPEIEDGAPRSFLDTALSMNLDGPPDLSTHFHEYLYGGREWPRRAGDADQETDDKEPR